MPRTDFDEDYFCTRKIFSPQDALFRRLLMFIALFALRRIISNICCSNQFLLCALNVPLAMLHRRYKIFLPSPLLTIQLFIVGLIIAIGLASITGFVKKKVCREKRFRWEGRDGSCGRAGIYYSYASFDSYHRLLA